MDYLPGPGFGLVLFVLVGGIWGGFLNSGGGRWTFSMYVGTPTAASRSFEA